MSIFHDDEDEDFTPNNEDREERMKRFLKNINGDEIHEESLNKRSGKKKLIDVVLRLGINGFIESFPKILQSGLYDKLMTDLYTYYTDDKFEDLREIDVENIIFVVKHFEDDEEYEKCQKLTETHNNIEYR